jgi:hypothetical protein
MLAKRCCKSISFYRSANTLIDSARMLAGAKINNKPFSQLSPPSSIVTISHWICKMCEYDDAAFWKLRASTKQSIFLVQWSSGTAVPHLSLECYFHI